MEMSSADKPALVILVSNLHGVDAALSDGSSQRAGHQPLRNAQRLLWPLSLSPLATEDQQADTASCQKASGKGKLTVSIQQANPPDIRAQPYLNTYRVPPAPPINLYDRKRKGPGTEPSACAPARDLHTCHIDALTDPAPSAGPRPRAAGGLLRGGLQCARRPGRPLAAKKRKMNFSEREVEIIVEEIEKQKHTLVNHFNAGVTHMAKNNAWGDILKKVNAVTTCPRELPEVKKKWSDMKTEVRRKVAQARAAIEGTSADCTPVPVILTAMQQRICNLLGEATIISLPAGDSDAEITGSATVCDEAKPLTAETTFHTLEDGGVVEYCTTIVSDSTPTVVAAVEAPVEMLAASSASPPPPQSHAKPQELKSRIALNSARLLQEQRVTNVHIRQIAQHMEGQNELLQMMRRSQEAQAFAQERQAQALEGTQAALLALVQLLKPALKDLRKFLQSGTEAANSNSSAAEEQRPRTPPPPQPAEEAQ
ncbi:hypothetical protein F7725_015921 [Dissostichus mawsoni]|uniref:Myb/SANT-like DNA-binding domain-containing protein n=1 Tax=Dissostichus mawsoni TaxID=36200 RepID=A0A7J5YIW5_DISMA|nr:hypothetical protein F7725_015921 [Dissostichus mawsoni]